MQTTRKTPDPRSEASRYADRCPFCGPTLERGPTAESCRGTIPSPFTSYGRYRCMRLPGHEGPCVACGTGAHCIAVSNPEAA